MSSNIEDYPSPPHPDTHPLSAGGPVPPGGPIHAGYTIPPSEVIPQGVPPQHWNPPPGTYYWPNPGYPLGRIKKNFNAIIALISSIAGTVIPFIGVIASLVGIILGVIGYQQAEHCGGKGKGMGISAIVIGVLTIVTYVVLMVVFHYTGTNGLTNPN